MALLGRGAFWAFGPGGLRPLFYIPTGLRPLVGFAHVVASPLIRPQVFVPQTFVLHFYYFNDEGALPPSIPRWFSRIKG